jgi:short-subunit dehydrogenase involved in D-alanine esterification of teichoic acids
MGGRERRDLTAAASSASTTRAVVQNNLFGASRLTQALLPLLRRSPAARIVDQPPLLT